MTEEDPNDKKEEKKKPWGMPALQTGDDIFGPSGPYIPRDSEIVKRVESEPELPMSEEVLKRATEDLEKLAAEFIKEEAEADKKLIELGFGAAASASIPKCGQGVIGALESFMEQEYRACREYRQIPGVLALSMITCGKLTLRVGMTIYKPSIFILLSSSPQSGKGETLRDITKHAIMKKIGLNLIPQKGSVEGLGQSVSTSKAGILINDEANSLFGGGKIDYLSGLPELLCTWYDGENPKRTTLSKGEIGTDERVFVDVALAIAPDTLYKIVTPDTMGGGMASRFIVIYGEKLFVPNWNPKYTTTKLNELKFNFVVSVLAEFKRVFENHPAPIELRLNDSARTFLNSTIAEWNLRYAGDVLQHYHERINENLIRLSIVYYLNRQLSPIVSLNEHIVDTVWKRLTDSAQLDFLNPADVKRFVDELINEYRESIVHDESNVVMKFSFVHIMRSIEQTFRGFGSGGSTTLFETGHLLKPLIDDPYIITEDIRKATVLMSISFRSDDKIKSALGGTVIQDANQIIKWLNKVWDVTRPSAYDTPIIKVTQDECYITVRNLSKRINKSPVEMKAIVARLSALGVLSEVPLNLSKGTQNKPMWAHRVYKEAIEHEIKSL